MPRPKGPGAIKFLDATKQDDVAMRRRLWRGVPGDTPLENKLNDLYTERAELTVRLINLRTVREGLRRVVSGENPTMKKLGNPPMARAGARMELPGVESKINSAETALRSIQKQIEETQKQIKKTPRSRQRKAVFAWQEQAIRLIMLHKFRHTPGDCVLSTQGATITTDELQKQLRAKDFKVGVRELRRFMRQCGVTGRQGKRTDLTSPSKPQLASLSSAVQEKPESNRELIEQRRAEQATLSAAQRAERVRKRDAVARAYEHYCDTAEGRAEQDHKKRLASFYAKHPEYKGLPKPVFRAKVTSDNKCR
jgi:hypothetical protein